MGGWINLLKLMRQIKSLLIHNDVIHLVLTIISVYQFVWPHRGRTHSSPAIRVIPVILTHWPSSILTPGHQDQDQKPHHLSPLSQYYVRSGSCIYRVFNLKKLTSTLSFGHFLWYSEAVFGVNTSSRVGALTFRQENWHSSSFWW